MAASLNPYLNFGDTARQAMEFYRDVFGGDITLNTFGEFGMTGTPDADKVMHSELRTDSGLVLMASDTPEGMQRSSGSSITVCLSGEDIDTLHGWWDKLSEGAEISMPLEKQMWGDEYGALTDRFGVPWMVNIALPKE